MRKYYFDGGWFLEPWGKVIRYYKPHARTEGDRFDPEEIGISIPYGLIGSLVSLLQEEGFIRPTMNNESRGEDLKIVHRLLDIVDKGVK